MRKWNTSNYPPSGEEKCYSETSLLARESIGKQIGSVYVYKPLEHTNSSYETAAWYRSYLSDTGLFPIILTQSSFYPYGLSAMVALPATITEAFFPSLWCGNRVGNYVDNEKGNRSVIGLQTTLVDACLMSGRKSDDIQCLVDLDQWQIAIEDAEFRLRHSIDYFQKCLSNYEEGEDDKFHSKLSAISFSSGNISEHSKEIKELKETMNYWRSGNNHSNWHFSNPPITMIG